MAANLAPGRRDAGRRMGLVQRAPDREGGRESWEGRQHAHEQVPRASRSSVADPVHDGLADVDRKRHGHLPPALAADQDLAGIPVQVVEPDGDDLLAAQAEPGHREQHRMVAAGDGAVSLGGCQDTLDLFTRQMPRRCGRPRLGNARDAGNQVPLGPAGREQEPEQRSQGCGRGSCAGRTRFADCPEMRDDVGTGDGVQVAGRRIAEPEGQEAAGPALTRPDRAGRQPAPDAQPAPVVGHQCLQGCLRRFRRLRRGHDGALLDEPGDEPAQDRGPIAPAVNRELRRQRLPDQRKKRPVDAVRRRQPSAPRFGAKPVDGRSVGPDGAGLQATRQKRGQECIAQGKQPVRHLLPRQRDSG